MTSMLKLYNVVTGCSSGVLGRFLQRRIKKGKEDATRLSERMGMPSIARGRGHLAWFHAASVGEAQSALILLKTMRRDFPDVKFLVTTGTLTSAALMKKRLPDWAMHQYYPLDHPKWVRQFLDHWRPDIAIWIESELWPNMLLEMGKRQIPVALVNARMSDRSLRRWGYAPRSARYVLRVFDLILAQTDKDAHAYKSLGAHNVVTTDSLKYAADPLPVDRDELSRFERALDTRVGWLYASTHEGEEDLAFQIHKDLKENFPTLLTIIAPRAPERAGEIMNKCRQAGLTIHQRSANPAPPDPETDIYLADTLGELGLFYSLSGLCCVGRSLSRDGGGGHNPIEAAQLRSAVLHGPNVGNFTKIYEDMNQARAALRCEDDQELKHNLARLFFNPETIAHMQDTAHSFAREKEVILENVLGRLKPLFIQAGLHCQAPGQISGQAFGKRGGEAGGDVTSKNFPNDSEEKPGESSAAANS